MTRVIYKVVELRVDDDVAEDEELIGEIVSESLRDQGPVRSARIGFPTDISDELMLDYMSDIFFYQADEYEGIEHDALAAVDMFDVLLEDASESVNFNFREINRNLRKQHPDFKIKMMKIFVARARDGQQ